MVRAITDSAKSHPLPACSFMAAIIRLTEFADFSFASSLLSEPFLGARVLNSAGASVFSEGLLHKALQGGTAHFLICYVHAAETELAEVLEVELARAGVALPFFVGAYGASKARIGNRWMSIR